MKTEPEIDRKLVADIIRELRAHQPFRTLKGNWFIGEWNWKVRQSAYLTEQNIRRFHTANS